MGGEEYCVDSVAGRAKSDVKLGGSRSRWCENDVEGGKKKRVFEKAKKLKVAKASIKKSTLGEVLRFYARKTRKIVGGRK